MRKTNIFIFLLVIFLHLNFFSQSRITKLNAIVLGDNIRIDFTISAGNACAGYSILKSTDTLNFTTVYEYGGVCGDALVDESHSFLDTNVAKNTNLFYKIYIPPSDYSKIVSVSINDSGKSPYLLFPMPVKDTLTVYIGNNVPKNYNVKLINTGGDVLLELNAVILNMFKMDLSLLPASIYYLLIYDDKQNISKLKVVKQ